MAVVFGWVVHEEQRQALIRGLGHQVEGFRPGLFVDDHRQDLGREEWTVVDRDHVDLVRQLLAGQGEGMAGFRLGIEVFDFAVFVGVVREILLVAHGAPA
ncbi:hypothetical protein D3C80_1860520 [compost metagenome]